ncbi:alpha/beta hydrolase [Porphyrobacter sp. LM 6]|jgi:acetyl esterase/lipase|uniref:alpha/beta hydrolase n=1 Tax=Porphyrobacter sp. LM 6 TaxID=1896196 RepID=UPI000863AE19|nr:alpha/beta hydrolase [Porphyrobacter sp. LM 6]AOL94076.1 Acetyl esterase/lipase [Porphyrobacter sp. LM 6]
MTISASTGPGRIPLADPPHSSANPPPIAPELAALDKKLGKLVVNRFTYRLLRVVGRFLRPPFDPSGVSLTWDDARGQRMAIVTPDERKGAGALILFHGGGFVFGRPEDTLPKAALFAKALGVPVICPAYRLAPQNPFPAALDDGHAAWHRVLARADALGIDPAKIVVGGYSAGGGLAANLVHRLHDEGGQQPAAQLLIYPMLDDRTAQRRELDAPRHSIWSNGNNRFAWPAYLGNTADPAALTYAVGARRADLSGLPPAWVGVGTCDLFLDEVRAYARRLGEAGVAVSYDEVDGGIHAFDMDDNPLAHAFTASQIAFIRGYVE